MCFILELYDKGSQVGVGGTWESFSWESECVFGDLNEN